MLLRLVKTDITEPQLYLLKIIREEVELFDPCYRFMDVRLGNGAHDRAQESYRRVVLVAHLHREDPFVMRLAEYTADTA